MITTRAILWCRSGRAASSVAMFVNGPMGTMVTGSSESSSSRASNRTAPPRSTGRSGSGSAAERPDSPSTPCT